MANTEWCDLCMYKERIENFSLDPSTAGNGFIENGISETKKIIYYIQVAKCKNAQFQI